MTWAAVDHKQRVVWGVGATQAEALADATVEAMRKAGERIAPGTIDLARLSDDADLDDCGEALYRFIIAEPSPAQGVLL